jgi:large subunit ribosomal protein L19
MINPQQYVQDAVAHRLKDAAGIPAIQVGDTINVSVRIIEGEKERIQVYQGVLIARRGSGINETITVRRIVANEGVERIFPLQSPRIASIEVVRHADARRAKLYYLRNRVGKSRRLRDQRRGLKHIEAEALAAGA